MANITGHITCPLNDVAKCGDSACAVMSEHFAQQCIDVSGLLAQEKAAQVNQAMQNNPFFRY